MLLWLCLFPTQHSSFWDSIEEMPIVVMPPLQEIVLKLLSGVNAEELKFKEFFLKVAVSVWRGYYWSGGSKWCR